MEEIHNLKLMGTVQVKQEIEYAGDVPEENRGSTKVLSKSR